MPKKLPDKMTSLLPELEQGALVELWEIDLRHISSSTEPSSKGELLRFHNGLNQSQVNLWWQGNSIRHTRLKQMDLRLADKGQAIDRH